MITGGLDEVGWGAAAGPLVSVVVVMKPGGGPLPKGITDSKKLSAIMREALFMPLLCAAADVGMGVMDPWEVDKHGPRNALQMSYRRALAELNCPPELLYVDGTDGMNKVQGWKGVQKVEPKADLKYIEVSMASIIAKVIRDEIMCIRARRLKLRGLDYNWEKNKGYLTPDHFNAIKKHGLLFGPEQELYQHRRSYCSDLLGKVPIWERIQSVPESSP